MDVSGVQDEHVAIARGIAERCHSGQADKAGHPYIEHPRRVAARLDGEPGAQAAAWLHDVLEDTELTRDDLLAAGLPERLVLAVEALTRRPGEEPERYYARVAADPLALAVKRADLADNADPARLAQLDTETRQRLETKYQHARAVLRELAGE